MGISIDTVRQYGHYLAEINYHRTDDLRTDSLPDKSIVHVMAAWIADKGERFEGEWIFSVAEDVHWLPQRDLKLIALSNSEEFREGLDKVPICSTPERAREYLIEQGYDPDKIVSEGMEKIKALQEKLKPNKQ